MTLRFRLTLIFALILVLATPILVIESPLVRSSASLGRLVFTDFAKPNYHFTVDTIDLEHGGRVSLPIEPYQDFGTLAVIDGEHIYVGVCPALGQSVMCTSSTREVVTPEETARYVDLKQIWKGNYGPPVWSPDSTHIAFTMIDYGTQNIYVSAGDTYVMNADGTNLVDLTPTENINGYYFDWSPDSRHIAFACANALYLCISEIDGSHLQKLKTPNNNSLRDIKWSPDSSQIAFTAVEDLKTYQFGIFLVNADGTAMHRLVGADSDKFDYNAPIWSPDSSMIAFELSDNLGYEGEIYVVNRDGTNSHLISSGTNRTSLNVVWSRDSKSVAFFSTQQYSVDTFLYVADAERGTPHKITDNSTFDSLDTGAPELFWIP